jgi:serine/threonine protein kinase
MTLKLDELNEKTNKASNDAQPLKISDFKETGENPRKGGRVTKWIDVRNKCGEFAFKDISEYKNIVQNQVTILKELHDCQSIIKFYGITCDGNKWYSVTEWAEYGNLREFYTNRKNLFNIRLKLRMSLDIARGLNFLRSLEVNYLIV